MTFVMAGDRPLIGDTPHGQEANRRCHMLAARERGRCLAWPASHLRVRFGLHWQRIELAERRVATSMRSRRRRVTEGRRTSIALVRRVNRHPRICLLHGEEYDEWRRLIYNKGGAALSHWTPQAQHQG